jgi:hypothetical protein
VLHSARVDVIPGFPGGGAAPEPNIVSTQYSFGLQTILPHEIRSWCRTAGASASEASPLDASLGDASPEGPGTGPAAPSLANALAIVGAGPANVEPVDDGGAGGSSRDRVSPAGGCASASLCDALAPAWA